MCIRDRFNALSRIVREEGLLTLWRGSGPTVTRAMIVTAGQLATYDQAKEALIDYAAFDKQSMSTHLTASLVAGVVSSCVSNPVDVVKTRMMNMVMDPVTGKPMYKGPLDCVMQTVKQEGVFALQKGLGATMSRQCPYVVVMFVVQEKIKNLLSSH
eukprot:TRINITY_DN32664_c0_g1_i3.p1 TRINITY_DN32664_c0_g1~~TRINITY_DN32664_c0_g1_i3.p1  ORF type:complete len:156 (+),score=54.27 TRINITY_DN32664_c0_g1_i3:91-558(+)